MTKPSQYVGQIQRPGRRPENADLVIIRRGNLTTPESSAGVGAVDGDYDVGNVLRYGADPTGVDDSGPAFQRATDVIEEQGGGTILVPPGDYLIDTQVTFIWQGTTGTEGNFRLSGYGAVIYSTGLSDVPFLFSGGTNQSTRRLVEGIRVDHWSNTNSTGAFEIEQTSHLTFLDCCVEPPDNPASGYAAWYFHQSTAATSSTGCFWNKLQRCNTRPLTGASTASDCVRIKGAINSMVIDNCDFLSCDVAILHEVEDTIPYLANGLRVTNCSFEGYTTAYSLSSGTAAVSVPGPAFIGNRFENGTTIFELDAGSTPITTAFAYPGLSALNYLVSNAGTYLSNSNSLVWNSLDYGITPDGRIFFQFDSDDPATFRNQKASVHALLARAQSTGYGFEVQNSSGSSVAEITAEASTYGQLNMAFGSSPVPVIGRYGTGLQIFTSTNLEDITHPVNTGDHKRDGWMVFNTTTNQPVFAVGNTDGAVWVDATGSTAHTPS